MSETSSSCNTPTECSLITGSKFMRRRWLSAPTSVVLNVAEGNGRYSELDQRFSPRGGRAKTGRRGATLEGLAIGSSVQASLRDAHPFPTIISWAQAHGYHHAVAPRLPQKRDIRPARIDDVYRRAILQTLCLHYAMASSSPLESRPPPNTGLRGRLPQFRGFP